MCTSCLNIEVDFPPLTHTLIAGLGDELPLTVHAGVGTLAGDPLLVFRHVARRR